MLTHRSARRVVLALALVAIWAGVAHARGGGGCLEGNTPVLTPEGSTPIGSLSVGQPVIRLHDGLPAPGIVQAIYTVSADEAFELMVQGRVLRATATHLFEIGPGVFREAERLRVGDSVDLWDGTRVQPAAIESIRRAATNAAFHNVLVGPGGTYVANGVVVHNKGCFLPDTPILKANGTETAISRLQPGDELLAFTPEGSVVTARVQNVLQHEEDEYLEIEAEKVVLRVTAEHPFYIGDGTFRTACTLRTADIVYAYDGEGLSAQRIVHVRRISEPVTVYNLQTDEPHTFFASGIAVHNKGGGCFPAGTMIRQVHGGCPIERLVPGDTVMAIAPDGRTVPAIVRTIHARRTPVISIQTEHGTLLTTAEHPLMTRAGEFRRADHLLAGQTVTVMTDAGLALAHVAALGACQDEQLVYNLTVDLPETFIANGFIVHNKGCFLPDTPILKADGTETAISRVQAGDELLAFTLEGKVIPARVQYVLQHEEDEYFEVEAEKVVLRVTAEHPFYVGEGAFRTASSLQPDDVVYAYDGEGLSAQRILNITRVSEPTTVYNLQTDAPHTFFANGIAVHNKGGGCFLPDTPVLKANGTLTALRHLVPGDALRAFTPEGRIVNTEVRHIAAHRVERYLEVETDRGVLHVTPDHPFCRPDNTFETIGDLKPGDSLLAFDGAAFSPQKIRRIRTVFGTATVYNLQTDAPHTFFANGFAVHNKGGGSYSSGSGSPAGPYDFILPLLFVGFWGFMIVRAIRSAISGRRLGQDLDFVYPPPAIAPKAEKTRKLLEFIAKTDADFDPAALQAVTQTTFVKLQQCWEARDYAPMKPLMVSYLYAQHCAQLDAMRLQHEINKIEGLSVQKVDIVNVRYTNDASQREFTALITARARDYYVDDKSGQFRRGDLQPATFQEFWTFQRTGKAWLLRDIEQSRESSALKEENFFEQLTDGNVKQVYGEAAPKTGQAGPWVETAIATKETRIDRLLLFLAKTDGPIWDATAMMNRARIVFINVMAARQSGVASNVKMDDLFPDTGKSLLEDLARKKKEGISEEYRNLCVRKVDLVLVRNYADKTKDEFTARISAHAQKVITQNGRTLRQDDDVVPFVEYWTFGRQDDQWRLKAVLPPAQGEQAVRTENVDEGTSPEQLQWYYRQTRAN